MTVNVIISSTLQISDVFGPENATREVIPLRLGNKKKKNYINIILYERNDNN